MRYYQFFYLQFSITLYLQIVILWEHYKFLIGNFVKNEFMLHPINKLDFCSSVSVVKMK